MKATFCLFNLMKLKVSLIKALKDEIPNFRRDAGPSIRMIIKPAETQSTALPIMLVPQTPIPRSHSLPR